MAIKFKSKNDAKVRVVLMSGHATIIGPEWKELDEKFHQAAYAAGCVSEDMFKNRMVDKVPAKVIEKAAKVETFETKVYNAIEQLVEENRLDAFTKSGAPDAQVLSTMIGERVTSSQRDNIWYKYQKDTGVEE